MKAYSAMLLFLVPTTPLKAQTVARQQGRDDVCRYGSWSRPQWLEAPVSWLTATGFHTAAVTTVAQRPTQADSPPRSAGYVVGVAGFSGIEFPPKSSQPLQWPPQLRAVRFDGAVFNRAAGDFWFAYPRAATDDAGTLHVVWAEPDEPLPTDPKTLDGKLPVLRSVWYATMRDGQWSRAERIFRRSRVQWDDMAASRLILDDQKGLHIAFTAVDSSGSEIVYLRAAAARARQWQTSSVRYLAGGAYLDLAVGPDRRLAIALVSGVAFPVPRVNVLSLTRSADGGATWTPVTPFSTVAEDPAVEPHVFFDRASVLHVEWVQQPTGTFVGGHLWHTTLDGTARGALTVLALPSDVMTSGSRAAIDSCGTIHVFTQEYGRGHAELMYTRTTTNGWSAWSRPFDKPGAHASIAPSGAVVHVVWSSSSMSPDSTYRSGLVHSTLPLLGPRDTSRRH